MRGGRLHPAERSRSKRFSANNFAVVNEELSRALSGTANHWNQSSELFARDQAKHAALGTRQNRPVRIIFFPDAASIFQHEDGAGEHLFWDPLAQDVQFCNHLSSLYGRAMLSETMWNQTSLITKPALSCALGEARCHCFSSLEFPRAPGELYR